MYIFSFLYISFTIVNASSGLKQKRRAVKNAMFNVQYNIKKHFSFLEKSDNSFYALMAGYDRSLVNGHLVVF